MLMRGEVVPDRALTHNAGVTVIERRYPLLLAVIVLIGCVLRVLCAQGDLWFDEAWSAAQARDAATPIGVFVGINHDNNHHLNSIWMQTIGFGAPPVLLRGLSIASGTLAIWLAARIAERQGGGTALITAWLFAVSPILVTMGSEARGYASMSVAFLTAALFIDRWLAGDLSYRRPLALALCFALGAMAQLTMVFGICALLGWAAIVLWQRDGFKNAVIEMVRVFAAPMFLLGLTLCAIFLPAYVTGTGFRFGRYDPFELLLYLHGMIEMFGYTIGVIWNDIWVLVIVGVLLLLARTLGASRLVLYRLAIFAFPAALGLLHSGNTGHPRYFMIAGLVLLLMLGEMLWTMLARRGWQAAAAAAMLAVFSVGALWSDGELVANQRADVGAAIRAMKARAPEGAKMLLDEESGLAMVEAASDHARYHLTIVARPCDADIRFLFIFRFKGEGFPPNPVLRCKRRYMPISLGRMNGMSGTDWTLYERAS